MKIKSMTASFGGLKGQRLEFGPGLNLIHGPNEAGKSTWCAFWKAMLYGIDTRERDRAGHLADKRRYLPWDGSPMRGELRLEWKGQDITIRRGPDDSREFGAFSAVYTDTGEPVGAFNSKNCGEVLTGVSREVFERSAFIGGDLSVTTNPDLEKRIAAIVSSGQEDVSYSQVESRLREWMNRRKVNRSVGMIPRLEQELAQVKRDLDAMSDCSRQAARLEGEYRSLNEQARVWDSELKLHEQLERQELDARFAQAQEALEVAQAHLRRLEQESSRFGSLPDREKLKRAQGELQYLKVLDEEIQSAQSAFTQAEEDYVQAQRAAQDSRFAGLTPDEASERAQADLSRYRDSVETARSKAFGTRLFPVLGLILGGACLAVLFFLTGGLSVPGLVLGAALTLAGVGLGLVSGRRAQRLWNQADSLLNRWDAETPEQLEQQLEQYCRRCRRAEAAAGQLKAIRGSLNDKLARKENDVTDLMSFVHTFAPEVTALFGCSAALSRALNLDFERNAARERVEQCRLRRDDLAAQGARMPEDGVPGAPAHSRQECEEALNSLADRAQQVKSDLDHVRGVLSSMGDPIETAAQKERLEEELERRNTELAALELAMEGLHQAYAGVQSRFSPELNRLAGEYLSRLTGHRYSNLALNRQMDADVYRTDQLFSHNHLYLSRGTLDQLYLSVRLAVCSLCLPDRPPIVLDDALISFDDERMKLAAELLLELSKNQQLLVFTCQDREGEALAGKAVTRLELG